MDGIIPGLDGESAIGDVDIAQGIIVIILRMEIVRSGDKVKRTVGDADGVISVDCLCLGGNIVYVAGDLQIVLADNAVFGRGDSQCCITIHNEIAFRINDAVCFVSAVEGVRHREDAVVADGDEHLIGGLNIDCRCIAVGDAQTVQHQLNLVVLARFHIYGRILCRA